MYTLYIYIILIRIAIIVYETILQNANFTGAKLILNSNSQKQAAKKIQIYLQYYQIVQLFRVKYM